MADDWSDLPLIRLRRAPSDAELEKQRDKQHAAEVKQWMAWMDEGDDW